MIVTITLFVVITIATSANTSDPGVEKMRGYGKPDFVNSLTVTDKLTVTWEVYNVNQTVIFEVTSNSTGWIGFGINNNGQIVPGDLGMGGVDENGVVYFTDRFATEVGKPIIDKKQDWHLIQASEKDGQTKLRFHRLWDTLDHEEDLPLTDKKVLFLWALGLDDNVISPPYHGLNNRGTIPVQILPSGTPNGMNLSSPNLKLNFLTAIFQLFWALRCLSY